ncbi:hypothetical protein Sjap_013126 [Stephania japonica]|uniref:Uncharacterized protein n=1 Tax=Stephania japonica TaxID=461633 RepID=A0AAP0IXF5_9MAGN
MEEVKPPARLVPNKVTEVCFEAAIQDFRLAVSLGVVGTAKTERGSQVAKELLPEAISKNLVAIVDDCSWNTMEPKDLNCENYDEVPGGEVCRQRNKVRKFCKSVHNYRDYCVPL